MNQKSFSIHTHIPI